VAALVALTLVGCNRALEGPGGPSSAPPSPAFSPEGKWRSELGFTVAIKLRPDGALEMTDARGRKHPFPKVGPEQWAAEISKRAKGSVRRDGDRLVFRREPTEAGKKPLAEKGKMILTQEVTVFEDRMTRVTEPASPVPQRAGVTAPASPAPR
jgi:hypothetical protein